MDNLTDELRARKAKRLSAAILRAIKQYAATREESARVRSEWLGTKNAAERARKYEESQGLDNLCDEWLRHIEHLVENLQTQATKQTGPRQ